MRKTFYNVAGNSPVVRRETPHYPSKSADPVGANTAKKEQQKYSGEAVQGFALVHKSNYVPVTHGTQHKSDPKRQ